MQRRKFIRDSTLTVFSISAFGSLHWNGKTFEGSTPTTTDILGPFYRPGAPIRTHLMMAGSKGNPVTLRGVVRKEDGKTPVNNALVEIWHCDENEVYDNTSDEYRYRGGQMTKADGRYAFHTIIPVPYKAAADDDASWRPAHIHMRVSVPGQQDLVTQIYFKGGKYVDTDHWSSAPGAESRVLHIAKNASGESEIVFDVILAKEMTLQPKAYEKICGIYETGKGFITEFYRSDDQLMMKLNGQLRASLSYIGNNSFRQGTGYPMVSFELLADGSSRVSIQNERSTFTGARFLKYPN